MTILQAFIVYIYIYKSAKQQNIDKALLFHM